LSIGWNFGRLLIRCESDAKSMRWVMQFVRALDGGRYRCLATGIFADFARRTKSTAKALPNRCRGKVLRGKLHERGRGVRGPNAPHVLAGSSFGLARFRASACAFVG
jgi:hypothetical protein